MTDQPRVAPPELDDLLRIGRQMANLCFNLKQRDCKAFQEVRGTMDECQAAWDSALIKYLKVVAGVAAVSPSEPGKVPCKLCGEEIYFSTENRWVHKQGRPRHMAEPAAPAVPPEPTPVGARLQQFETALAKIDAIRNSIVGRQTVSFSAHIYPLVAALEEAGFHGEGYEVAHAKALAEDSRAPAGVLGVLEALKRDKPL